VPIIEDEWHGEIKMKKSDLFVAWGIVALMLAGFAAGFMSCQNALSDGFEGGTGQVRVQVQTEGLSTSGILASVQGAGAPARTIYPTRPEFSYVYTFTRDDEEGAVGHDWPPDEEGGSVFTLPTGRWNLEVYAYLETDLETDPPQLAAFDATGTTGSSAAFTITQGHLTGNITITLAPNTETGTVTGTLDFTITYPAGATLNSLIWENADGDGTEEVDHLETTMSVSNTVTAGDVTTFSGTMAPVAGQYLLTARLTGAEGKTAGKDEVVHIYQNLTTYAVLAFEPSNFTKRLPSGDARLVSVLGKSITAGAEAGTITAPITASITVEDIETTVYARAVAAPPAAANILAAAGATPELYFDDSFGGAPILTRSIILGTRKHLYVKVTSEDGKTRLYYDVTITTKELDLSDINDRSSLADVAAKVAPIFAGSDAGEVYDIVIKGLNVSESITTRTFYRGIETAVNAAGDKAAGIKAAGISLDFAACTVTSSDGTAFGLSGSGVTADIAELFVSVTLPAGLTKLGNYAFRNFSKLTSITLPPGLTSIGNYAFYYCAGLTDIILPPGLTSIGNNAFYYCPGLTDIILPDNLTSIGDKAFQYCEGLDTLTFTRATPPTVGNLAFDTTTALASGNVYYPSISTGYSSLYGAEGLPAEARWVAQ
jgi:hypothetical protein